MTAKQKETKARTIARKIVASQVRRVDKEANRKILTEKWRQDAEDDITGAILAGVSA